MILFLKILVLFMTILFLTFIYMLIYHFKLHYLKSHNYTVSHNSNNALNYQQRDVITMKAIVACNRITPDVPSLYQASGYPDCHTLQTMFQGNMICRYGCLGLGSCIQVCPTNAIKIKKGTITILDTCTGCGKCISECPKQLISLIPVNSSISYPCAAYKVTGDFSFCTTAKNEYLIQG